MCATMCMHFAAWHPPPNGQKHTIEGMSRLMCHLQKSESSDSCRSVEACRRHRSLPGVSLCCAVGCTTFAFTIVWMFAPVLSRHSPKGGGRAVAQGGEGPHGVVTLRTGVCCTIRRKKMLTCSDENQRHALCVFMCCTCVVGR